MYVQEEKGQKNKRKYDLRVETLTDSDVIQISDLTHDDEEVRELLNQYTSQL